MGVFLCDIFADRLCLIGERECSKRHIAARRLIAVKKRFALAADDQRKIVRILHRDRQFIDRGIVVILLSIRVQLTVKEFDERRILGRAPEGLHEGRYEHCRTENDCDNARRGSCENRFAHCRNFTFPNFM